MAAKQKEQQPQPNAAQEKTEIESGNTVRHVGPEFWNEDDDPVFFLAMDHWLNEIDQLIRIDLSRDEYLACKRLVGQMRGIKAEPESKAA
jgi:hypothetical protein